MIDMSFPGHRTDSRTSQRSAGDQSSSRNSGGRPLKSMASVLEQDRSRNRKDRTFIGGECAVCEEPLELTLRGERILQLSCSHIAHEACFYEYLREVDSHSCPTCNAPLGLDSSRGGSVPNIGMYYKETLWYFELTFGRYPQQCCQIKLNCKAEGLCANTSRSAE